MTIMFFLPYFNTLVTETLNIFSWNISLHSSNIIFFYLQWPPKDSIITSLNVSAPGLRHIFAFYKQKTKNWD